ncbi:MAG: zinc ribbon domain-containing protein [Promethearchaeota archaeon]
MPIYEYECRKCKERFEVLQRINDDATAPQCPKCGANKAKRVLSGFFSTSGKSSSVICGPSGST